MPAIQYKPANDVSAIADFIANTIKRKLKTQKVLWLVSGGSATDIAAKAADAIASSPHANLTVTLTDERFGSIGHSNSNWQKLLDAGFSLPQARLLPILTGKDRTATTAIFADALHLAIREADFVFGLFGIGADGHTAGILPHSNAVSFDKDVVDFTASDFERITITPRVIEAIDEAAVYAVGTTKWPAIAQLQADIAVAQQPAQALKHIPVLTIFTDYKGETQ
jgi:6-phosphogluconolactonase/glucosamine-6-phosphate isomerase/deaminase